MRVGSQTWAASIASNRNFEILVTIFTLTSVAIAVVLYLPQIEVSNTQKLAIYAFDFFVVILLGFDFITRVKASDNPSKYIIGHWYEIPAMLPLLIFASLEEQALVGAAVRSFRLIRLLRLARLVRLANLFRTIQHTNAKSFVYLVVTSIITLIFGSIAIYASEVGNEGATIVTYDDAVWFALTTMTISGYGDVYPVTAEGKIIAAVLIFVGLALVLGFIANVGAALVDSKLKTKHKLTDEHKEMIKEKIDELEKLDKDDVNALTDMIKGLHSTLQNGSAKTDNPKLQ